jgi:putative membrane protein
MKNFIFGFIRGLAIGIGAITPGVSGGALAAVLGIYERLTDAIAHITEDFHKKLQFLLPLGIGGVVGVLAFSRVIEYLFENYNTEVRFLFIGLMSGALPSVFKQANKKGFRVVNMIPFIIAAGTAVLLTLPANGRLEMIPPDEPTLLQLALYGAIIGVGTIIPGISASVVLIYLGGYQVLLAGLTGMDPGILIPAGVGYAAAAVLFANLISHLFKRAYGLTYYAVLGFVLGSILLIFPGEALSAKYILYFFLLAFSFYISYWLGKFSKDAV